MATSTTIVTPPTLASGNKNKLDNDPEMSYSGPHLDMVLRPAAFCKDCFSMSHQQEFGIVDKVDLSDMPGFDNMIEGRSRYFPKGFFRLKNKLTLEEREKYGLVQLVPDQSRTWARFVVTQLEDVQSWIDIYERDKKHTIDNYWPIVKAIVEANRLKVNKPKLFCQTVATYARQALKGK